MNRLVISICCVMSLPCSGQSVSNLINTPFPDSTVQRYVRTNRKPVILDFFSSSCSVCFKMMPKVKALQSEYDGKIQFILVGNEDGYIKSVYKRFEKKWNLNFPVIFDSVLPKNLGIRVYPTYVWIDQKGLMKAFTGVDEISSRNLEQFYTTGSIAISSSQIKKYSFDPAMPLFVNGNGGPDSSLSFQFLLGGWHQGQPIYLPPSIDYFENSSKFQALGATIDDLYNYAYHSFKGWDTESKLYGKVFPRVVVQPEDSSLIRIVQNARYCISMVLKDTILIYSHFQRMLKDQLDKYLGCESHLEIRKMPCWFLEDKGEAKTLLKTKGGVSKQKFTHTGLALTNLPVSVLVKSLFAENQLQPPIIDVTGINFNIDLRLEAIMFDFNDVQKALLKQGLKLVKGEQVMQTIVLKPLDKNVAVSSVTATF